MGSLCTPVGEFCEFERSCSLQRHNAHVGRNSSRHEFVAAHAVAEHLAEALEGARAERDPLVLGEVEVSGHVEIEEEPGKNSRTGLRIELEKEEGRELINVDVL